MTTNRSELVRGLGVWGAASLVVGNIIGSGIFLVSSSMIQGVGTPEAVFLVWVFGGLLSLSGALTYAELGTMLPKAGGEYVYLREAYGPLWGFLYGWSRFLVMTTGAIATLAAGFARYFNFIFPDVNSKVVAIIGIIALGTVNYFGVKAGGIVQTFFTILKVGLILALACAALLIGSGDWAHLRTSVPVEAPVRGFVLALVAALWAYQGWSDLALAAGEVADPQKNIPRSLVLGTAAVGLIYILANVAYFYILSAPDVAASPRVAGDVARRFLGGWGGGFVALAATISIFGALNGTILTGSRVPFAMAADGLFFGPLAQVHSRFHSPHIAVVVQSVLAAIMTLTGSFEQLFTYTVFAYWCYYGLAVAAVFVLRRKHPEWPRPYRTLGYPVVPALFILVSGALVAQIIYQQDWWRSLVALGTIGLGVPAYFFFRSRARAAGKVAPAVVVGLVLLSPAGAMAGTAATAKRADQIASPSGKEVVLFALNDAAAIESLRLHRESATIVSPQWYAASADGNLSGAPWQPLLEACRELRIPVAPAVTNRDFSPQVAARLLTSPRARARLVRELREQARRHGFRGYVIDFENLPAEAVQRRGFFEFLRELRASHSRTGLWLGVALPPPTPRHRQVFDYRAVGRIADRVVLMAYDQHGRYGVPGPIAGYGWVDSMLRETIALVPRSKLLLGVAFYHRNWGETGATAGSYNEALALQREHGADWRWHPSHRAHWFGFVKAGSPHTVWVEDARSVAEKLALARRYRLAGVAGWRLGQEDPRVWILLDQFAED